jgi:hypothetical protein
MNLVLIGFPEDRQAFLAKLPTDADLQITQMDGEEVGDLLDEDHEPNECDLLVVLNDYYGALAELALVSFQPKVLLTTAIARQLAEWVLPQGDFPSATILGWPGAFVMPKLEVGVRPEHQKEVESVLTQLGWEAIFVADRVGLVTPRVVLEIINEAALVVQEGTATAEDIDTAMKLGTNYPGGPFEWAERIGYETVVELLNALYEDTKNERYAPCAWLKTKSYEAQNA